MNQLNYHKQLRAIARFLIGILVVVSINLIDSSIFVNRVFGANSSNKNLLNVTPDRDKVSICIAGFCVNTPNIPNIIKAPIEQGINSAIRDQLRSFLSSEIPITGTEHKLYPSTPELPGGRFAPNTLYLSALQSSQYIPSGDYEIPVHFYCTKVYTLNGAGNRFRLARLEGRLSNALSNLYQRASLNNVPIQDVQVLSWSIQSGVPYDNLSNESKRLVDRLIPDYRQELNGSFTDQTIRFWNTLAAVTPLPSLDETLNQLGDVGNFTRSLFRAREEIIRSNFNYRNLANNFVLQQDFNLPGGVESTSWSQINDRVYLRFIAPSGALRDGVAQVRILDISQTKALDKNDLAENDLVNKDTVSSIPNLSRETLGVPAGDLLIGITQSVGIPEQNGQAITASVTPPPEVAEVINELKANPEWKRNLDPCPCNLEYARELTIPLYSLNGKELSPSENWKLRNYIADQTDPRFIPQGVALMLIRSPIFVESSLADFFFEKDFHPGASYAFRSHASRVGYFKLRSGKTIRPGQQCTYDSGGKLITDGPGAGTPDAYAPEVTGTGRGLSKSPNYKTSHTYWDIEPFNVMSNKPEDLLWYEKSGWKRYQEIWTSNKGNNCSYNYKSSPNRSSPFYNPNPVSPSPRNTPLW
jgi:hypothetical protein